MVTENILKIQSTQGEGATTLMHAIAKLETTKLHGMKSMIMIERICFEVMDIIDKGLLVRVNEESLKQKQEKKEAKGGRSKTIPREYSEVEITKNMVTIREDWGGKEWTKESPRGWIWREDERILGVLYRIDGKKSVEIFLAREIADSSAGALLLIQTMKEKLRKLTKRDTKNHLHP